LVKKSLTHISDKVNQHALIFTIIQPKTHLNIQHQHRTIKGIPRYYNTHRYWWKPYTVVILVCLYNGEKKLQGESWLDGCKFNCSCDDASIGFYTCRDL